jgi:hypothetical protein
MTAPSPQTNEAEPLDAAGDPILKGAAAIARYLSPAPEIGPPMSEKQIYRMIEKGAPFRNIPGLGVAVRISTLKRYLDDKGA